MNPRADFCPGCGAQVYPEEEHCPFCGRKLHTNFLLPFMIGLGGTTVALAAGGLVWWVMSAAPSPSTAVAPSSEAVASAPTPQAPAAPAAPTTASMPATPQPADVQPAPTQPVPAQPAPAGASVPGDAKEAALPLPTVRTPVGAPPADASARKAFAKLKQDNFVQNGLDLSVTATGEEATVLTIKFTFDAKAATELILAGPLPRQCEQRGFRQLVFADPSGTSWVYDVATRQLTQR